MTKRPPFDDIPDVRDGLTRVERAILYVLDEARAEFGERYVPTALIYGRVVEYVNIDQAEFQRVLARLGGMRQG
jgi:hypothetical protein